MTPGESLIMAKLAAMEKQVVTKPCRCWSVGHFVHQGHCCHVDGATCHEAEGAAILHHGDPNPTGERLRPNGAVA